MNLSKQFVTAGIVLMTLGLITGCGTSQNSLSTQVTNDSGKNLVKNKTTNATLTPAANNSQHAKTSDSNDNSSRSSSSHQKPSSPHFMPSSITFMNSKTGYVSGVLINGKSRAGCIYKTIDGGHSWKRFFQKANGVSVAVFRNNLWINVSNQHDGSIYFSKDEGQDFTKVSSQNIGVSDVTSKSVGWAGYWNPNTQKTVLMKTTDGGKHWNPIHLPGLEMGGGVSVGFANAKDGLVLEASQPGAGNQGKALLRTTDGGKTWRVISNVHIGQRSKDPKQLGSGGYADGIEVVPSHPAYAYIWESRGPLLYTSDGGKSWHGSPMTQPSEIEARGVSMQTPKDGFILLQDMVHDCYVLEHTNDGGVSGQLVYKWSYSLEN